MISLPAELPARIRAFVAVCPNAPTRQAIARFVEEMRARKADATWVKPDNLHLTLRFLGDQAPSSRLAELAQGLIGAAASCAPFCVTVAGVGAFPEPGRPRVIWIGFESAALVELASRVEQSAQAAGFAPVARAFAPHLTIGRVRSPRGFAPAARALAQARKREFGRCLIDAMTLYRSELSPAGPTYYELLTIRLGAAAMDK